MGMSWVKDAGSFIRIEEKNKYQAQFKVSIKYFFLKYDLCFVLRHVFPCFVMV